MNFADYATLLGWGFPDVPLDARLVHVRAGAPLPVAGSSFYTNGLAPHGGTSYVYSPRDVATSGRQRTRLVGFGASISNAARQLNHVEALGIGAAGVTTLLLSLGASNGSVRTPFQAFRSMVVSVLGAGTVLVSGHGAAIGYASAAAPLVLGPGFINASWTFAEVGVAAVSVAFNVTDEHGYQAFAGSGEVKVQPARVKILSDGSADIVTTPPTVVPGVLSPRTPVLNADGGTRVSLYPVAPGAGGAGLGSSEAFGVEVVNGATGPLGSDAWIAAELLIATWPEE